MLTKIDPIVLEMMESKITIEVPDVADMDSLARNITQLVTELEETIMDGETNTKEDKVITDVWAGIVLTLLVLSCAACMCSCLLYHKFQMWKRRELEARSRNVNVATVENGSDRDSLPSYTIVSGLPSYEEALKQLNMIKQGTVDSGGVAPTPSPVPATTSPPSLAKLSVSELLMIYRQPLQAADVTDKS